MPQEIRPQPGVFPGSHMPVSSLNARLDAWQQGITLPMPAPPQPARDQPPAAPGTAADAAEAPQNQD
ncbi:hypothetical protein Ga0061061_104279 [Chelatococcus sambhunathii]|uniref:Uncharacterized protein n=1 Tax=Chelatococcus sambhunathii TaxID=363953 RepID=A0ABM9U4F7_9HYPH|nr:MULTISPECIES: hypothetical protein [Chelatococcus]CUA88205.1 hypothetical protein Ga0061061_104279 [Chelatococcus sambhunathii]